MLLRFGLPLFALAALTSACGGRTAPPQPGAAGATASTAAPDFGQHHHPIRTSVPAAQEAFDRGFALVFGFNHEEAVRSFARAAELDPASPMPHWGIAWALGPNYNLDIDDPRSK